MKKLSIIFACALPAALAACGGGGGNGAPTFSPLHPHIPTDLTREPAAHSTIEHIAQTDTGNNAPGDGAQSQDAPANTTYDVRTAMKSLYMKGYKKQLSVSSGNFDPNEQRTHTLGHVDVTVDPAVRHGDTTFNVVFNVRGGQIFRHGRSTHAQGESYSNTYDAQTLMYESSSGLYDCTPTFASGYPTAAKAGEYGKLAELECRDRGHGTRPIAEKQLYTYTTSVNPSGGLDFDVTRQSHNNETGAENTTTYNYLIKANGVAELTGVRLQYSGPHFKSYDVTAH